ncbi:uncharacterized protein MELLADRAFT_67298 [Melampsora larici-populina 98AG31]|uniref:Uncharacterized protein n=1 Tax=Melampsora larici-populina (strain 98AG31 / pathotype 3-4-7) TaxID=747676 RepID=F4S2W5_MELLP|nr:uncharacterized protein MELLADRAFT_67298 [Melampsora larici-populina 98AG31]EGG01120.1 hypothetical protein MELLADRAFT_67298 [Melampsora larici-populina 98AG31]
MPLRSGLQINTPTHSISDSDESEASYKAPKNRKRRPAKQTTTKRAPRKKKNQTLQTDGNNEDNQANLALPEFEADESSSHQVPNLTNYQQLGVEWGLARAEKYLADSNFKNQRVQKADYLKPNVFNHNTILTKQCYALSSNVAAEYWMKLCGSSQNNVS